MGNVAKDFAQLISQSKSNKTGPYDTQATVKRVEGNTVWVSIPGGVDETPIDKTVNCTAGDKVQVRVSGGRAWITGNASAPPTDDKTANEAKGVAVIAQTTAVDAKETADAVEGIAQAAQHSADTAATAAAQAVIDAAAASSAAAAADAKAVQAKTAADNAQSSAENASEYAARALGNLSTVQSVAETLTWITAHGTMTLTTDVAPDPTHVYFVVDAGGDYTVGGVTYAIVTEPVTADMGTYYELSIDESLNNYVGTHLALDSEGLWLLPASSGTNKVLIATGAGSTYTTAGTYIIDSSGNTVASFRANGATIGEAINGNSRAEIGTDGMKIIQKDSGSDTEIAHMGYGPTIDNLGQTVDAPYYTLGQRMDINSPSVGSFNSAVHYITGNFVNYNDELYIANEDNGPGAWDSDDWTKCTTGLMSVAEGESVAAGYFTHTEGWHTFAGGFETAHAEGNQTMAAGTYGPHAEGFASKALAEYGPHAEGYGSVASGNYASHAEGFGTKASGINGSHSEGYGSVASGGASHAQNEATIAASNNQTALGKYNVADNADTYAVIVGNGTADNARSNALTVEWNGDVKSSGDIEDGSGNVLADKADTSAVPTKTSDLANDSGYITAETDPTVPSWAKASTKPTYTASEVGALPDTTTIPANTSDLNNDSGFISADSSGNVSLSGSITTGGHNNPIGYTTGNNTGTWSVTNASETNVPSANLTPLSLTPGVWIVFAQADFSSNSTGRRFIEITTSASGHITRSGVMQNAVSGGTTKMLTTAYLNLTNTQTVTIRVYQNSGAARSTTFNLSAVRIA